MDPAALPEFSSYTAQGWKNLCRKWRNVVGFFILGLVNNYPYVIMLSAAYDIIHRLDGGGGSPSGANETVYNDSIYNDSCTSAFNWTTNTTSYKPRERCSKQGTSVSLVCVCVCVRTDVCNHLPCVQVILLADILPTLLIKLTAPYWMQFFPYW